MTDDTAILLTIKDLTEAIGDLLVKRSISRPGGYRAEYRAFTIQGRSTFEVVLRPVVSDEEDVNKET